MKRFIATIVALMLMCVSVSAELPAFLTENYNNYTATYNFSMTFENADEILALLDETGALEEVSRNVDIKALLESMLSCNSAMTVQANISEDFRKTEIALTSASKINVIPNKNLNISANSKMGIWIRTDLDASEPVFEIIYTSPLYNKYMTIDVFSLAEKEGGKEQLIDALNSIFNKENVESFKDFSCDLIEKYAKITMRGATCVIQIDNDGLIGIIKEVLPVITENIEAIITANDTADDEVILKETETVDLSILDNLQLLGKDGITYTYSLFSGKVSKVDVKADISLDISKIVTALDGEEWSYKTKGILDFMIKSEMKLTNLGKTKVEFPALTEENSFSYEDTLPDYSYEDDADYEYYPDYPDYYVYAYADELPVLNGEYYVPLRETLKDAYYETINIEYSKGIITLTSEYFTKFDNLKLEVHSTNAYVDGVLTQIPKVIVSNGKTYVGVSVFEDIFGWELSRIEHDILNDTFYISFYTELSDY